MDVINVISKVKGLPDAPVTAPGEKYQLANTLFANGSVSPLVSAVELTRTTGRECMNT